MYLPGSATGSWFHLHFFLTHCTHPFLFDLLQRCSELFCLALCQGHHLQPTQCCVSSSFAFASRCRVHTIWMQIITSDLCPPFACCHSIQSWSFPHRAQSSNIPAPFTHMEKLQVCVQWTRFSGPKLTFLGFAWLCDILFQSKASIAVNLYFSNFTTGSLKMHCDIQYLYNAHVLCLKYQNFQLKFVSSFQLFYSVFANICFNLVSLR